MSPYQIICHELYDELKIKLSKAGDYESGITARTIYSLSLCEGYLERLKKLPQVCQFADHMDKIYYAKIIKPLFESQYIFYSHLFELHARWPALSIRRQRKQIGRTLNMISRFYIANKSFYEYYRSGQTGKDEIYFMEASPGGFRHLFSNSAYISNGTQIAARFLAYGRLQEYLHDMLARIDRPLPPAGIFLGERKNLKWTGLKSALVELIYALKEEGVFEHGQATIQEIAEYLGADASSMPDTYQYIRSRRNETTMFLTNLRNSLQRRIDRQTE